ncbi:RNA-guided endonuclease InsQ/TnpB family protein, partial [Campylobacter jejuni]
MLTSNNLISISHKIELIPNNKAKTHFKKAFGCSRLAYNWGLAKWQEYYKQGIKKSHLELKKEFNAIKKERFPFVYEVSKYATQQPFVNLNLAFNKFFKDLKQGKISYPKFKKKRESFGSYYIGGDQVIIKDNKYLKVPNLGNVKLREKLRFIGKINSVTISQKADKFYASFSMQISQDEYNKTHKITIKNNQSVGIDLGIKEFISLSNGLQIKAPKPLNKLNRLLVKRARQLSKKQHAKTKQEVLQGIKKSNNYKKASIKLNKLHSKISNI